MMPSMLLRHIEIDDVTALCVLLNGHVALLLHHPPCPASVANRWSVSPLVVTPHTRGAGRGRERGYPSPPRTYLRDDYGPTKQPGALKSQRRWHMLTCADNQN
jgi:hypothetical protein